MHYDIDTGGINAKFKAYVWILYAKKNETDQSCVLMKEKVKDISLIYGGVCYLRRFR